MLDRQKEAVFNILGPRVPGCGVVDLFAGSGALGLEALSRGALRATFVERGREALLALRTNVETLGLGARARILPVDALRLDAAAIGHDLGLVFCDPPFPLFATERGRILAVLERLAGGGFDPEGTLVLRVPSEAELGELPAGLRQRDARRYGESIIHLLEPVPPPGG
jgi:16S rRNA (guanine966-N2)-methyltransferase